MYGLILWIVTLIWGAWRIATEWTLLGTPTPVVVAAAVGVVTVVAALSYRSSAAAVMATVGVVMVLECPLWCVSDGVWLVQTEWYTHQMAEVAAQAVQLWSDLGCEGDPAVPVEILQGEVLHRDGRVARWVVSHADRPWMRFGRALWWIVCQHWC